MKQEETVPAARVEVKSFPFLRSTVRKIAITAVQSMVYYGMLFILEYGNLGVHMAPKLIAKQEIRVGEPVIIDCMSPTPPFGVVFEDDGSTGYFYALDMSHNDNPIIDALHIYNVASVTDRHLPSKVQIIWSQDDKKAALLINDYPHAIFDFEARRGYCRTGFPPPSKDSWTQYSHEWDDKAKELFR